MKKLIIGVCLLLGSCAPKPSLQQLKQTIVQESKILYVECDEKQQSQLGLIQPDYVKHMIVLESLLEIDNSQIILIEAEKTDKEKILTYFKHIDSSASYFSKDTFFAMVKGEDISLVQRQLESLQTHK